MSFALHSIDENFNVVTNGKTLRLHRLFILGETKSETHPKTNLPSIINQKALSVAPVAKIN